MKLDKRIPCYGCGALVLDLDGPGHPRIGAASGCWQVYGELLAREYGVFRALGRTHLLTVAAYTLQHPGDPSPGAIQSLNTQLVTLYLLLEQNQSHAAVTAAVDTLITNHAAALTWLSPPSPPYPMTVLDVLQATSIDQHRERVDSWALAVWDAWSGHHQTAADLARRLP